MTKLNLTPEQMEKRRRAKNAEYKQRQRARQASMGDRVITIVLTAGEVDLLARLRMQQRGPIEGFERRALLLGATFAANAGNPRGKKARGNVAAAAITGRQADMSASEAMESADVLLSPAYPSRCDVPDSEGCPPCC